MWTKAIVKKKKLNNVSSALTCFFKIQIFTEISSCFYIMQGWLIIACMSQCQSQACPDCENYEPSYTRISVYFRTRQIRQWCVQLTFLSLHCPSAQYKALVCMSIDLSSREKTPIDLFTLPQNATL